MDSAKQGEISRAGWTHDSIGAASYRVSRNLEGRQDSSPLPLSAGQYVPVSIGIVVPPSVMKHTCFPALVCRPFCPWINGSAGEADGTADGGRCGWRWSLDALVPASALGADAADAHELPDRAQVSSDVYELETPSVP